MDKDIAAQRLKAVSAALNVQLKDMAEQTGINFKQMYAYSGGQSLPNWTTLDKILSTYPTVSAEFLMRGKGAVLHE